jgi:hypothetical protein
VLVRNGRSCRRGVVRIPALRLRDVPDDSIPPSVRRLIAEYIDTVPELEALLLVREPGDRTWSAEDAGRRLYVSTPVAAHVLSTLAERGFFVATGDAYCYAPASPELAAAVDELAATYARQVVAVTRLIHGKPSASVRQFADAFRLRRPT